MRVDVKYYSSVPCCNVHVKYSSNVPCWALDQLWCRKVCRWRHQTQWQTRSHWGRTAKEKVVKTWNIVVAKINIVNLLWRSAIRRTLEKWTKIVTNFHQECWNPNSLWQHWCQTRGQWKSVCRSHPEHPRAERNNKHNNLSCEGWFHLCWSIARTRDKCSVVRAQTERRCFKKELCRICWKNMQRKCFS